MSSLRTTRVSLFARLCGGGDDPLAWEEFIAIYAPAVHRWCRQRGLQEADAESVTQDVMLRFWKASRTFRYDPSRRFRAYLKRIVLTALADWSNARKADRLDTGAADPGALLDGVPAREELAERIEQAFDMERLAAAMEEVEAKVKPHTWRAFCLLAIDGCSGQQVADELGMSVANAYMARMRVQRLLSEVLARDEVAAHAGGNGGTVRAHLNHDDTQRAAGPQ
jgi:RNA polymerase sigma factor (sigma-70 family)